MLENIARAQNSRNLRAETDRFTHDTETLAAVGLGASRLASLLLSYRNADQEKWAREVVIVLANQIIKTHKLSRNVGMRVAAAALIEWAKPHCRECNGARNIVRADGVVIICESCGGIGMHRYSDKERSRMIDASFKGRIADAYDAVLVMINQHVGEGVGGARRLLGWGLK